MNIVRTLWTERTLCDELHWLWDVHWRCAVARKAQKSAHTQAALADAEAALLESIGGPAKEKEEV